MTAFNDRRPPLPVEKVGRTKAALTAHLQAHGWEQDSFDDMAHGSPSLADLQARHEDLHEGFRPTDHTHEAASRATIKCCANPDVQTYHGTEKYCDNCGYFHGSTAR